MCQAQSYAFTYVCGLLRLLVFTDADEPREAQGDALLAVHLGRRGGDGSPPAPTCQPLLLTARWGWGWAVGSPEGED